MAEEKKVMYKVITAKDLEELTKLVNRTIGEWYAPYWDLFNNDDGYHQVMVDKSLKDIKVWGAVGVSWTITANIKE